LRCLTSAVLRVPPWLIMMQTQLSKFSKVHTCIQQQSPYTVAGQRVTDFAALGFFHGAT